MSSRMLRSSVLVAIVFAAHVLSAADPVPNAAPSAVAAPLTLTLNGSTVAISGISPRGQVYVYGVMRTNVTGYTQLLRYAGPLDAAQDGSATLTLREPFSGDAFFFAIDLASGGSGRITPGGQPVREFVLPDGALKKANNGQLQQLETHLPIANLLLVRPGTGAWELTVGDGGPDDDDHAANGISTNRPEQMNAVGRSPEAPKNFRADDLLFVFDPMSVAMLSLRVKE